MVLMHNRVMWTMLYCVHIYVNTLEWFLYNRVIWTMLYCVDIYVNTLDWCQCILCNRVIWTMLYSVHIYVNTLDWCQCILHNRVIWTMLYCVHIYVNTLEWCQCITELYELCITICFIWLHSLFWSSDIQFPILFLNPVSLIQLRDIRCLISSILYPVSDVQLLISGVW